MKKQTYTKLTCVQCGRVFKYKVALDSCGNNVVSVCSNPCCPNYALLAMPIEQMPVPKKKK